MRRSPRTSPTPTAACASWARCPPRATYRITFATGAWFAATGQENFYPEVSIAFTVTDPAAHHHVPLLLAPYAYSTYRGS